MGMNYFMELENALQKCDLAGPATEAMIRAAEGELQVAFPDSYRHFLATYGAALCDGFRIAGLFGDNFEDEPPLFTNVVTYTNQLRRASRGLIPHSYIAISDDGGGHIYYLNTSHIVDGECPVIVLGPAVHEAMAASDFLDFLEQCLKGSLP